MTIIGPTSHAFVSQRLKLHYVDWGNPSAPPLLLVHGGRDHCRSWDWVAEQLRGDWHVIALDLRGHGDSSWSSDGNYTTMDMVYDVAQLIDQLDLSPVTIVAHSWGGNVCTRYAGLYPDRVRKLVAIEGLGPSPKVLAERAKTSEAEHIRKWIADKRGAAARSPRRYPTIDEALARMQAENAYLTDDQARHLTIHGITRNEDGTWSWKFDPHLNVWPPFDLPHESVEELWRAITCPTLLLYGADSWASNPAKDGRLEHFSTAELRVFDNAGHWLHHDQFEQFMRALEQFL
jgi:pimeloyl-ACP methyl ester carboxylesterase